MEQMNMQHEDKSPACRIRGCAEVTQVGPCTEGNGCRITHLCRASRDPHDTPANARDSTGAGRRNAEACSYRGSMQTTLGV